MGVPVPVVDEGKFHRLIFDRKFTFTLQIQYLKQRCMKALTLLQVVACMDRVATEPLESSKHDEKSQIKNYI